MSAWRRMSEAPKDGTEILCFCGLSSVVARWSVEQGYWHDDICRVSPTCWVPIPKLPTGDELRQFNWDSIRAENRIVKSELHEVRN